MLLSTPRRWKHRSVIATSVCVAAFVLVGTYSWPPSFRARAAAADAPLQVRLGYPADKKLLIINADDLAVSPSEDDASFSALEHKWVSSATVMVPCPWFTEVADYAKAHP